MLTEDDLRTSLREFARDIDELAVRDRIEQRLTVPARPARSRLTVLAAVAACVALAVGLALAVQAIRNHRATPTTHSPAPSNVTIYGMKQFPGTIVLAHFSGTGSKSFDAGTFTAPKGLSLQVVVTCRGHGRITVGPGTWDSGCSDPAIGTGGGSISADQLHPLTITTAASSAWQITLVAAPDARTNGGVVSPGVTTHDVTAAATGSGSGNGSVSLDLPASDVGYEIYATCNGSGIAIDSDSPTVRNDYTRTCFPGFSYNWKIAKGSTPKELRISAAHNTSWTVIVTKD